MKNTNKNNKILALTGLTLLLTTLKLSTGSFVPGSSNLLGPRNITELKKELKAMPRAQEQIAAKTIVIKNDGINYQNAFIPKTDSKELKVLTVRLTVYWARGTGTDADSRRMRSSTGYTLKQGDSIAVDPRIIPYDKEVIIPNVGLVKAVDTGTAVKDKVASNGKLPVIDVFFVNKSDALEFANRNPKVVKVAVLN
jgi:3D (Asp-Asp-Asp) domain-containing protein